LSHRQSDNKRQSSEPEPSELIKIDDQELLQALEKASRTLEISQIVEEEPIESSNNCEEIMEPTISQLEIKDVEAFIVNSNVHKLDTNGVSIISSEQHVCLEPEIISAVDSLTENLDNFKLSPESDHENEVIVENDSITVDKEVETCSNDKVNWTEMVEKEDHCECPKVSSIKRVKKDEEPMLFEGIKFKGKKKRGRKKNQARATIKLPNESYSKNKANDIVKSPMKNPIVEEDCDSAHSIDHSIDTNDAPNTIYSDIRSEVSLILQIYLF